MTIRTGTGWNFRSSRMDAWTQVPAETPAVQDGCKDSVPTMNPIIRRGCIYVSVIQDGCMDSDPTGLRQSMMEYRSSVPTGSYIPQHTREAR